MGVVAVYSTQPMLPAFFSADLQSRSAALPWGGPTGSGGPYIQGSGLTLVATAPQPEIWVLTVGSPSGSYKFQFIANDIATTPTLAYNATAAQICTGLQTIFPTWMLPTGSVTGSTGGPYTITFAPNARIGGAIQFVTVSGSPAPTLSRSQRGSVGAAQYDVYDGSTYTTINALLKDGVSLGVSGGLSTTPYGPLPDETWPCAAYISGYFNYADIPNITTAAVAAGNVPGLTWHVGSASALAGAIVKLNQ